MFSKHCDHTSLLIGGMADGEMPALAITLNFSLRGGARESVKIHGLVDTGASITILPGYLVGLSKLASSTDDSYQLAEKANSETLAGKMDFEPVPLTGVFGTGRVPGYRATIAIAGHKLPGEILVGALVGQWKPLIGRDVLDRFILSVDPWRRTSMFAARRSGRLLSILLNSIKGRCVEP
jgi:predicted aspartyl protease